MAQAIFCSFFLLVLSSLVFTEAFVPSARRTTTRSKPLYENFGLDIGEDPVENTLQEIYGEVNYKNFVGSYKDDALLLGGKPYNIIEAIRVNKLLSVTVDSGLLEALESKGITLSQIEKLLPVADDLGVLPLVKNNKKLLVSLAPLLIEPAPLLLPVIASVLKTPAANFQFSGVALLAAGAYELGDNVLLAVPLLFLGVPLAGLGAILGSFGGITSLPSAESYSTASVTSFATSSSPSAKAPKVSASKAPVLKNRGDGGTQNGKRKLIKIK